MSKVINISKSQDADELIQQHNVSVDAHANMGWITSDDGLLNEPASIDADTLGGIPAYEYAQKEYVEAKLSGGKRTARFTVGTSTAGWTSSDCDYLCDGVDDQVEINAAIQALPATGGEVVILDGDYNITAAISMDKDNVTLSGNGTATKLYRKWSSMAAGGTIAVTAPNGGCAVENLCLEGNYDVSTDNGNHNLYVTAPNTRISGVHSRNGRSSIYVAASLARVVGNFCRDSYFGIYLGNSSTTCTVSGNVCTDNSHKDIYVGATGYHSVSGNVCNGGGILLQDSSNNSIQGNVCTGGAFGLMMSGGNQNTVIGNTFNDYNNAGIYAISGSSRNILSGNNCMRGTGQASDYSISQYPIWISGAEADYNLVIGNMILGKNYYSSSGGTNNEFVNNKYQ